MTRRLVLVLLLAVACRRTPTYTATGDVVQVDLPGNRVTLNHDPIPDLMPAMTMSFPVEPTAGLAGITPGTRVRFELRQDGTRLTVTHLTTVASAGGGRPGIHDHTPHHDGVVAMTGMLHLEARATADGRVQVWLTDVWRRPLPLGDVAGSVTLFPPDGVRTVPLAARDGALDGSAGPLTAADVRATVRLVRAGETVDANFLLPLQSGTVGAAAVPTESCRPPAADAEARGLRPRCVLAFPAAVTAAAATADATRALVAVVGAGVTTWQMPAGTLATGLAPPPPMTVPMDEAPHGDVVNAVVVSPDSREAVVTLEGRLVRYEIATGRLLRVLAAPRGVLRALAWSPDGAQLLVTAFYDRTAHLLHAEDGTPVRAIPLDAEAAGVAFSPDGRWAAVGTEAGPITLVERTQDAPGRVLSDPQRPSEQLAFAGNVLVSGGAEGVVWTWDAASGVRRDRIDLGTPVLRLAVVPGTTIVAVAGQDLGVRLYDVERGGIFETLTWHRAPVGGLAWAGRVLISGDTSGAVALWDLSERLAAH